MDVNGTRFHLLLGLDDWARCTDDGSVPLRLVPGPGDGSPLRWDPARGEITLRPKLMPFRAGAGDTAPTLEQRRGAGRDRSGNWYWIDESVRAIRVRSVGSGLTSAFWPPQG